MNYDTMTFKELVQETINHSCHDLLMPPDDWLDMMRKAVIREASVAECNLDVAQGYPYVCVRGSIDTFHSLKNGEYHLVPKETP